MTAFLVQEISPNDVVAVLKQDPQLKIIDVREDDELAAMRTNVATHLPLSRFDFETFEKKFGKQDAIYILCRSGARSRRLADALAEHGYEKLHNITGGILAWNEAGLPTITG